MEHQLLDNESVHSRIPRTGVNKCFLFSFVIVLSLGALNFGYSLAVMGLDFQSFKC